MTQENMPGNEDTWEVLSFLSGMGLWLLLAIILVAVVLYKKFKK
tara:strand:+ start:389 stop:520 length:132 start_codon:yes stop_codon:yes gene_type:complete